MKFKGLVFLLIGLMIFQMFPCVHANAAETEELAAVRLMLALDIMEIDEYTDRFWYDVPVRRAEMAKILCKLYGLEPTLDSSPRFTDVSNDDRGYVETIARNGYMSGISEEKFGSKEYITNMQLVKIYVTMLDGDAFANSIGGYPDGYITAARRLGLSPSDIGAYDAPATQLDVAEMIYEAMNTDLLQLKGIIGDGASYDMIDGQTFLTEKLDIYIHVGVLKANDATSLGNDAGTSEDMVEIDSTVYHDPDGLCDGFLGYEVVAYEKKSDDDTIGKIIYVEPSSDNQIIELDNSVNTFKSATDSVVDYYKGDSTRHIKLGYAVNMIYNGRAIDYDIKEVSGDKDEIKFIDNNGDNLYDVIVMYKYSDFMVDSVDAENEKINLKYGEKIISLEDQIVKVYRNGEKISLGELTPTDIISVAISGGTDSKVYTIKACQKTVSGSVTSIHSNTDGEKYVEIGGTDYKVGNYYSNLIKKGKLSEIEPNDSGTFYLNVFGEIVASEVVPSSTGVAYLADWGVKREAFDNYTLGVLLFTEKGKLELMMSGEKINIDEKRMEIKDLLNDANSIAKLDRRELVKYTSNKGVIKKLEFAVNGYSGNEFSVDVNADLANSLSCTRTTVLDNKWKMSTETKVFRVPIIENSTAPGISNEAMDESLYSIVSSPFIGADASAKVALYDIQLDNSIGYALWPNLTNKFVSASPLVAVSSVGVALNEDGDQVTFIEGYNESNQETKLHCRADISIAAMPKVGDVVQYTLDYEGNVDSISIVNSVDAAVADYGLNNLVSSKGTQVLGEVAYVTNNQLSVYFGSYLSSGDITPDMIGAIVADSNKTVVEYNSAAGKLYPIEFSEISNGDKVYAAINSANTTRILVVYK